MKANKLSLTNFRNYEEQEIEFGSGINIIYGDNAQGKTNILEAVHMFSMGKSNRTSRDSELIRHGEPRAKIYMEFSSYGSENFFQIEMFRSKRKSIAVSYTHLDVYKRQAEGDHVNVLRKEGML